MFDEVVCSEGTDWMSIKTVFTSRIKRWGKRILNNSGLAQRVFRRIVMSDQASRILLNDNVALLDLVSHADFGKSPSHAILQQYLLMPWRKKDW